MIETEVDFENKECGLYTQTCETKFDFKNPEFDLPSILNKKFKINIEEGLDIEIEYNKALEYVEKQGFKTYTKNVLNFIIANLSNTDIDVKEIIGEHKEKDFVCYFIEKAQIKGVINLTETSLLTKYKQLIQEKLK
jgi:hypothetical protein